VRKYMRLSSEAANGEGLFTCKIRRPKNTGNCDSNTADLKALPTETCGYGKNSHWSNNVRSSSR
jgi:hypothetical protein